MNKKDRKLQRRIRVRSKVKGTKDRLRLSVFKSNRFIYAQLIDDEARKTIIGLSEKHLLDKVGKKKIELAKAVGALLAKKAIEKKIKKVVFDRGGNAYHGRISAVADGAREGGLEF
ncbi:MAG: 50S ribosomal protein L18 [Patescibacteria group bacterium]